MSDAENKDIGFELDKLDIDIAELLNSEQEKRIDEVIEAAEEPKPVPTQVVAERKTRRAAYWIAAAFLVMIGLFAFFWEQNIIRFPLFTKSSSTGTENYFRVGPIVSKAGEAGILRMTVSIDCEDSDYKERVAELDEKIKNQITISLATPRGERLIAGRDYELLKQFVKREVNKVLYERPVDNIYFSDILVY